METLTQLHDRLNVVGQRLEAARQIWLQHLTEIHKERDALAIRHPTLLKKNAWASQQACSAALARVEAFTANLRQRIDVLERFGHSVLYQLPLQQQLAASLRFQTGPETGAWQMIRAIVHAQVDMEETWSRIETYEICMTEQLELLTLTHTRLDKTA